MELTKNLRASAALTAALLGLALVGPVEARPTEVPRCGLFELPLDADGVATFTAPSGAVDRVGAFPARGRFRVRWAPREEGLHRYAVVGLDGAPLASGEVLATPSASRGHVRVDPDRPRRLRFDDGAPLLVLGENRMNVYDPAWNHDGLGIDGYLAKMAAHGMTTLRVFMFTDAEAEDAPDGKQKGCIEPRPGVFDDDAAEDFDEILAAGQRHGIHVIFTLYACGFTPGDPWKGWEDNPYHVRNGGPAEDNWDAFEDGRARELARGRLRYVMDRWAWSPNLLAIDLLNEPEWDGDLGEDVWRPWAEDLARTWRAEDPYGHPVTVGSVGLHWNVEGDEHAWWGARECDVVQWHLYGPEVYQVHALAAEMHRKVQEVWHHGKPVLVGEFAWGGEDTSTYDHTHVGLWSATFAGAGVLAHSAPPFTLDSDHPMTPARGAHFRALRDLLAPLEARGALDPDPGVRATGVTARALGDDARKGVWVLGPKAGYGEVVRGASVRLALPAGDYVVTWHDDVTAAPLAEAAPRTHAGGELRLAVPPFTRHAFGLVRPASDLVAGARPSTPGLRGAVDDRE